MLNIKILKEKQIELENILKELSEKNIKNDKEIKGYIKKLQNIYIKDFRHSYSRFFFLVGKIDKEGGVLEYLLTNIEKIKVAIEKSKEKEKENNEDKDFPLKIFKLADHLNLEISRYYFSRMRDKKTENKNVAVLETKIQDIATNMDNEINKVNKKLSKTQVNAIAVIGIFSGITFAFSSGTQLFVQALASINQVPWFKLALFIPLIAGVLFGAIYFMFDIIRKLIDRI